MKSSNLTIGAVWAQYGPYHFARFSALQKSAGIDRAYALEIASQTSDYEWRRSETVKLTTLCPGGVAEQASFFMVFRRARRELARLGINVCLLPSYSPKQSLAVLLAAKSLGIRTVMMNESHGGTARTARTATWMKRRLAGLFHAALVGGNPQRRYFAALGMPQEKIFTGYDAVENDYFVRQSEKVRSDAAQYRKSHQLPERYFLSLGRFVTKKNLLTLIRAFHRFLESGQGGIKHLVIVGSGEEEKKLRDLCAELRLPLRDKRKVGNGNSEVPNPGDSAESDTPAVHFYGFRQIDENPIFYALADAFVLPSFREEWGLVVNEAMACGLPVIVSETAGCAEDLLEKGLPAGCDSPAFVSRIRGVGLRRKIRRNGFVFDPNSADELSRALLFINSFPQMQAAMSRASSSIVKKFSCDNFGKQALLAARVAMGEQILPGDWQTDCSPLSAEA